MSAINLKDLAISLAPTAPVMEYTEHDIAQTINCIRDQLPEFILHFTETDDVSTIIMEALEMLDALGNTSLVKMRAIISDIYNLLSSGAEEGNFIRKVYSGDQELPAVIVINITLVSDEKAAIQAIVVSSGQLPGIDAALRKISDDLNFKNSVVSLKEHNLIAPGNHLSICQTGSLLHSAGQSLGDINIAFITEYAGIKVLTILSDNPSDQFASACMNHYLVNVHRLDSEVCMKTAIKTKDYLNDITNCNFDISPISCFEYAETDVLVSVVAMKQNGVLECNYVINNADIANALYADMSYATNPIQIATEY